jgi:hypothetical protein
MSEEEEYYEEGEFEEGEEGEEEEVAEEEEEEDAETKRQNALADIALIHDIFSHIECTSRRITENLLLKEELRVATETIKALEAAASSSHYHDMKESDYGDGDDGEIEEDSVTWSQYEELDDARRAKLLEKSIMLLGGGGGGGGGGMGGPPPGRRGRPPPRAVGRKGK